MIWFCADDYGISKRSCERLEACLQAGTLNKVSVLANGEIADFKTRLSAYDAEISLHLNLVEGRALTASGSGNLLVDENGYFKHSFIGLCLLSFSHKRKALEVQIYHEICAQLQFWKTQMGEDVPISMDSHQHTHMIPLVFKTLLRAIEDEKVVVSYLRIPAEPILPYLCAPSLYHTYRLVQLIKQWLLKFFALVNRKRCRESKIKYAYFMGVLFSGKMDAKRVSKVLSHYERLADKHNMPIEVACHPGYLEAGESLMEGVRQGFYKFYTSPWRKAEFEALHDLKIQRTQTKEGFENAVY